MLKYDAILLIEKLEKRENDNYKKYLEINGADEKRRQAHESYLSACLDFLHEIRANIN